jgi:hypothetical protein
MSIILINKFLYDMSAKLLKLISIHLLLIYLIVHSFFLVIPRNNTVQLLILIVSAILVLIGLVTTDINYLRGKVNQSK